MQCCNSHAGGISRDAVQRHCDSVDIGQRCIGGIRKRAAFHCQHYATGMALEQLDAKCRFQPAHMVAHRAGGQSELFGSIGEILVPCCDRENAEGGECGGAE
jgi:hypothetical protein